MGYRSQVTSLIFGTEDKVLPLVTKHKLMGGGAFESFKDDIRVFATVRQMYDHAATNAQEPDASGNRPGIWKDVKLVVVELTNNGQHDWKWYDGYRDVQEWEALLDEARDAGCCTEFARIGEDDADVVHEVHLSDDLDSLDFMISIQRQIVHDYGEISELD